MDWTEKHRPETLSTVRGNDKAVAQLREWADTWDRHRECVILHGPPGIGKTSSAHALAADEGWSSIELNASDQRTKAIIETIAGEAARSGTLTDGATGRRLVIIDEADNLHGNVDRGGTAAISRIVGEAGQPVVLIANEYYDMSRGLRNGCREIEFRPVSARSILPVLRDVCRQEGLDFEDAALERIAEQTDGDLRSAIQDLQAIASGRTAVTEEDVITGDRDRTEGIFDFLDDLIKEAGPREAQQAAYRVDETPDDLLAWIDENLPKDYTGPELAAAYRHLALADRWLGRTWATQQYRFWRYATNHMTAGVAAARTGHKGEWTRYGPPSYRRRLGQSRGSRNVRDAIAGRIADAGGMSIATARREVLPFLSAMTHHCKPSAFTEAVATWLDLDETEVSHLTGSGESTQKVAAIVEQARDRGDDVPEPEVRTVEAADTPTEGDDPDDGDGDGPDQAGLGDFA